MSLPLNALPPDSLIRFSWVLDRRLAVGSAPRTYEALRRRGFTAAVSLQEDSEVGPAHETVPRDFDAFRIPIRDGVAGGVPTVEQVARAAALVKKLLDDGRTTYVHCYAGVGRSPMACVAYLARFEKMTLEEATALVLARHAFAAPNDVQVEAVDRYLAMELENPKL